MHAGSAVYLSVVGYSRYICGRDVIGTISYGHLLG
jgi:hypothetical protein